jgi:hypothetical protein
MAILTTPTTANSRSREKAISTTAAPAWIFARLPLPMTASGKANVQTSSPETGNRATNSAASAH